MYHKVKDVNLYYETHGGGMPILMLHGFKPDSALMIGCMEPIFMEESGYQRIYIDLPGMGKTENYEEIHSADDVLSLLLDFIDEVIGAEPFLLAGESYGAYLSRGILQHKKEQVRGLLQICPVIHPDKQDRNVPPHQVLYRDQAALERLSAGEQNEFAMNSVVLTAKNWRRFVSDILSGIITADHNYLARYQKGYALSVNPDNETIYDLPSLFLFGKQDSVVGYRDGLALLEYYPRGSFAVLDMAGHNLQIEQENVFNELVVNWLERARL